MSQSELLEEVRREIVDLHVFFADWFNGVAHRDQWQPRFTSRLSPNLMFMPPEGFVLGSKEISNSFAQAYGTNSSFKIQIHDVIIRHDMENHVLATYTEWQTGAKISALENNARFTTVLMEKGAPIKWLHVQQT
ncbi:MAG: hypothetical protein ACI9W2_003736 [Gammaproteobacteria bacterium]|jgi:hypothetical protein